MSIEYVAYYVENLGVDFDNVFYNGLNVNSASLPIPTNESNVKDVDNLLENVLDSENTEEDPSNMTALGGDEEDEVGEHNTNGSEPDDKKKSNDPPSRQRILKSSQEKFIRKRGRPRKVAKQSLDGEEEHSESLK